MAKSPTPPRKHHFIQAAYLEGFTDSSGKVHVFDRETQRAYRSAPASTGFERDFYTLRDPAEGVEAHAIETEFLARIESPGLPALRALADRPGSTKHATRLDALRYMALAHVRGPVPRREVFRLSSVLHYGVANMPGAVPRTSSLALSNATLRYALKLADKGLHEALRLDPGLANGLNTYKGQVTHPAVAETFKLSLTDVETALWGQPEHF